MSYAVLPCCPLLAAQAGAGSGSSAKLEAVATAFGFPRFAAACLGAKLDGSSSGTLSESRVRSYFKQNVFGLVSTVEDCECTVMFDILAQNPAAKLMRLLASSEDALRRV